MRAEFSLRLGTVIAKRNPPTVLVGIAHYLKVKGFGHAFL